MSQIIPAAEIPDLLLTGTPLLDVRAPVEFLQGAFPGAHNLPLLQDHEREAVGKVYKSNGQQAAIEHGNKLVDGTRKAARVAAWAEYCRAHPGTVLYCFRGGLRSRIAQEWLAEAGLDVPRVEGGYKRMRRVLLDTLEHVATTSSLLIVAGKTGSGKTHLINQLRNSVDLEGLASHRGSAFGNRVVQQPTQINFENELALAFLRLPYQNALHVFLEDESRSIGSLSLPVNLHATMLAAPIAVLEESLEQRVQTILQDYIVCNYRELQAASPATAQTDFAEYLLSSLAKIRRRLGGENYEKLHGIMQSALADPSGSFDAHSEWIEQLLVKYYDPMYAYQLGKKSSRIMFRGTREELLHWAAHLDISAQQKRA